MKQVSGVKSGQQWLSFAVCLLHLVNSARTAAHSPGSGGDDSSLQISIKVMFIYMQITKSDKQFGVCSYPCLPCGQDSTLLRMPTLRTGGQAYPFMCNQPQNRQEAMR
ncbi:hypothetical protein AO067_21065 [Pseudomonas viridiflava ICMP 13104]|uniref:Uncharacterized protein n=1 Tax=Pseudomonas viridiflava ICMP 13104 TaxID=1198305 RepID=A0A0W0HGF7_PSEVI|nr:hypothetical protein AO067_21065 [Pseudomonas viridiflava ICMP 13104]